MSAPMILARLAGRERVTRRLNPSWLKVQAGDHLWFRENCRIWWDGCSVGGSVVEYQADGTKIPSPGFASIHGGVAIDGGSLSQYDQIDQKWRPSILMPYAAHRLDGIAGESARVEHLLDITDEEAILEGAFEEQRGWTLGFPGWMAPTPREAFLSAFAFLHPKSEPNPELVRIHLGEPDAR